MLFKTCLRLLLLTLAVPIASLTLSSCSNSGSSQQSSAAGSIAPEDDIPGERVEIPLWHALTGPLEQAMLNQIATFHTLQDDVRITPEYKGSYPETLQAGLQAIESGSAPALLQVYEAGTATMARRPSDFVSIDSLMQQTGSMNNEDYLPLITSYFSGVDGELLSLPYNVSTPVLFINRDALNQAGIDMTVSTRSWNDVQALLQTLKDQGHACPYTTSWPSWIHLETYSARHDLPFATAGNGFELDTASLIFNGEAQIQHIDRLRNWSEQDLFVYSGIQSAGGAPFRNGSCALLTESSASRAGTEALAEFDFEVRPLPYDDFNGAPMNSIIGGASLWVTAGQTPEIYLGVAQFINFLSTPVTQAAWHQQTGYLPITQSSYDLSRAQGYYERVPDAEIPVLQMTNGNPGPNTRGIRLNNFVQIRQIIEEELALSWDGANKPAEQALNDAVNRATSLLQE